MAMIILIAFVLRAGCGCLSALKDKNQIKQKLLISMLYICVKDAHGYGKNAGYIYLCV
jgi:hypothetical protein